MSAFTLDDSHGDTPLLLTEHAPRDGVPLATGDELRRYVAAHVANEHGNSDWTGLVIEDEEGIIVQRVGDDDDRWLRDPETGLYALDGFDWTVAS